MITVISVGKKHQAQVAPLIDEYQKRLRPPYDLTWKLVPHSNKSGNMAVKNESDMLIQSIKPDNYLVILDEKGHEMTSPALSERLQNLLTNRDITLVIGGAYGVNDTFKQRANEIWALSRLTLPHMLVRLLITEQIYRSQAIAGNQPYHHS